MYNVMMIDDNPLAHLMMKKMLAGNEMISGTAHSLEARPILEYLVEYRANADALPDMIFLDLQMPAMNGWEFLLHFNSIYRSLAKQIRIYIISAVSGSLDRLNPYNYPFVRGCFGKPVSKQLFTDLLATR